jgi:hypothetical protein
MKNLLRMLFLALVLSTTASAQFSTASNNPDCFHTETLTTATSTASFDNRELKCRVWKVQIMNLSNASAAYYFERSSDNSTFTILGSLTGLATVTAGSGTYQSSDNYFRVRLTSKGTGNVIISFSGYAYQNNKNNVNFDGPPSVAYTLLREVVSATVTYVGQAKSIFDPNTNTSYAITAVQKITSSGGEVTLVQWADGDTEEDNVWANRASLTYK